jgi:hypothetical protein
MFYLINENNVRFGLKEYATKAFIPSVAGMGYEHNLSFIKVGDTYQNSFKEIAQGTLSGTAIFKNYENYLSFVKFVEGAESLRMIYKPIDTEYFRDVVFKGITKVIRKASTTEAEVNFFCKGLWYTATDTRFTVENIEGQSSYDLLFDYTFNDFASTELFFTNNGHTDAQLIVELYGFIENPVIQLFQNNVKLYEVSFTKEVLEDEVLIYSAKDGHNFVKHIDALGVETNAIATLNLTKNNFFKLPKGTSKIVVSSDGGLFTKIVFRIITQFKGV